VTAQTPNQTWAQGEAVDVTLAANTFTDPQREALTYSATVATGAVLPTWLHFNATTVIDELTAELRWYPVRVLGDVMNTEAQECTLRSPSPAPNECALILTGVRCVPRCYA